MSYSRLPAFVLGFHGCDRRLADRVINRKTTLRLSNNDYDWLGHGIYFWENSPKRANQWANEQAKRAKAKGRRYEPAVIGAVIDLGNCLDLMNAASIDLVRAAHTYLKDVHVAEGIPLPTNDDLPGKQGKLLRRLDCAVINVLHTLVGEQDEAFDSVRAAFMEGPPIYPNAGFLRNNHIQICVRNTEKIRGYFLPVD
jgi:hypothetical protein